MPDITLCKNKKCGLDCYRRLAIADKYYQSYSLWKPKNGDCEGFWACKIKLTKLRKGAV